MAANQARTRLGRQSGRHDRIVRTPFGHQQPCPGSCTRSSRSPSVRRGCFPATGLVPYFGRVCAGACIRRAPSCRRGLSRTCVRSLGLGRRDGQRCADEREWLNACGKLPTCRCPVTSYSSASRPRSFASPRSRSKSVRASWTRPLSASALTSQNEQARNCPSSPGSPSSVCAVE
jgi:hypothetical protein